MYVRSSSRLVFLCLLACFSLVLATNLHAQLPTADMIGTVTDSSGAAVPNAHVSVRNTGTAEMRTVDTGATGDFAFSLLQLGTYTVSIEAMGFKKFSATNITLASGDRVRVDAKMELGDVNQTVEVTAVAPALQTDTSTLSGTLTEQAVQDLPLNGRNFIHLAQLTPGASEGNVQGFGTGTRPDDRRPTSEITVNAQNDSVNNKTIDGMDNNEGVIGSIGVQPSIDAIQEVHVQTNLYTAEVGRTAGAAIDIITKSGTNNFHGSIYEFLRNDKFDARSYFDTPTIGRKPELRQNQFGGSVGGPIKKDKTFFFGDYEGERLIQGLPVPLATVPTACELGRVACGGFPAQLGNFSDLIAPGTNCAVIPAPTGCIIDPATGNPFPNNIIPVGNISTIAKNFAALYPTPNLPGFTNNFGSTPNKIQYLNTVDARVDHHFGSNDTLSGRYTLNNISTQTPGTFPKTTVAALGIFPGGDSNPSINAFAGGNRQRAQNTAAIYTHIFSPNVVMQLNAAYLRVAIFSTPLNYQTNASTAFGLNGINVSGVANGFASGLPLVQPSGYANIGDDNFIPLKYVDNTFQYNGNISWIRGAHVFKFGAGLIHRNFEATQSQFPDANYTFDQRATSGQSGGTYNHGGGNSFASLLTGVAATVQRNLSLIAPYYSTSEPNFYAQDNWRARSWLTLNLGVRWDYFSPWTERHNFLSNFNPTTGLLQTASSSDRTAQIKSVYHDFAPRIGFAATLGHGMVLRGGFGTTFFPGRYASFFQLKNPPFSSSFQQNFGNSNSYANQPSFSTAVPAPTPIPIAACPFSAPANPSTCATQQINAVDPNWRPSYVYQTSLQLQKDFGGNVVSVAYVGEFGRALSVLLDINQLNTPGPEPNTTPLLGGAANAAQPYANTYGHVAVISEATNAAMSHYNGLQVSYERRFKAGLTINANYTFGHEIDDAVYPGFGFYSSCLPKYNCIVDNGNGTTHLVHGLNYEKGNGAYNVPNRWVGAINYQLPFGKSATGLERQLVQGWQFNTLASWTSGLPTTIQETNNAVLSQLVGNGGNGPGGRPNQTGALKIANPTPPSPGAAIPYINLGSISAQTVGTLGNLGRNNIRGLPLRHWDFSLFKNFPIREGWTLQFRYEVFNVTNTANFSLPIANITAFNNSGGLNTGNPTGGGGFGTITSTVPNATPRQMQFALKLLF